MCPSALLLPGRFTMQTLLLDNGDRMPMLGLGTWKSAPGDVQRAVKEALRLGYRHVDCAFIYDNEREVGRALAESTREGVVSRDELWVTSKLWNDCHAPEHVRPALEAALADLQLDYLDLYLVHWPVALKKGVLGPASAEDFIALDALPLAATWGALESARDAGLCRHIGVSNLSAPKLGALIEGARVKPEVNQVELHPYLAQSELVAFCAESGVHVTAYSPLGSPDRPPQLMAPGEPVLLQDPTIAAIAAARGATSAQVLIRWALERGTAVIPKSVNPERLKQNLAAADVSLTDADMEAIAALDRHRRYVDGSFWEMPGGPYTLANLWDG